MRSIDPNLQLLKNLIKEFSKTKDKSQIDTYPILIWSIYKKYKSGKQMAAVTHIELKRIAEIMEKNNATPDEENLILDAWASLQSSKKKLADSFYNFCNEYSGYESPVLMNYADKHGV